MTLPEPSQRQDVNLLKYWHVVKKFRRMVAAITATVVLGVAIGTKLMTPYYAATATLEIDPRAPNLLDVQEVFDLVEVRFSDERRAYYTTQYRIIRSRAVVGETLRRLQDNHGVTDFVDSEDPIEDFLKLLTLTPEGDTELVHLTIEHPVPELAVLFANTLAEAYMDENIDRARRRSEEALEELKKQKDQYASVREESELEDPETLESSLILAQRYNTVEETIRRVQTDLAEVQTKLPALETEFRGLQQQLNTEGWLGLASHLATDDNQALRSSYQKLQELRQEEVASAGRYKEEHPKVLRLNAKLSGMEELLRRQVQEYINGRKSRMDLLAERETALTAQLEDLTRQLQQLEEAKLRADREESEAERREELYRELGQRLAEAQLSNVIRQNNVAWVDLPIATRDPVRPRLIPNIAIALMVGLMGSVGLAFFIEYLRPDEEQVKSTEDIEQFVGVPLLGALSMLDDGSFNGLPDKLYVFARPRSILSEQMRTIRTNILFRSPARSGVRRLLITSAVPQEGKSFVSSNLAAIVAMSGSRILLIDADLRRPRQHEIFASGNLMGLSNVLAGEVPLEEAVHHSVVPGLDLLPAGPRPDDVDRLFSSDAMERLLDSITGYDFVLVDSPPITPVADPLILSHLVDGVIMVVRFRRAHKKQVLDCRRRLTDVGANVLGAIGNRVDERTEGYYGYGAYGYGYGQGYGYGYGYGQGYGYYGEDEDEEQGEEKVRRTG